MTTTSFGSPLSDPARSAALLRATAAKHGVPLQPATPTQLAASVLAAHCWALAHHDTSLVVQDAAQAPALAALLLRAAGHPGTDDTRPAPSAAPHRALRAASLRALEPVAQWAWEHGGEEALSLAADDLELAGAAMAAWVDALDVWEPLHATA